MSLNNTYCENRKSNTLELYWDAVFGSNTVRSITDKLIVKQIGNVRIVVAFLKTPLIDRINRLSYLKLLFSI